MNTDIAFLAFVPASWLAFRFCPAPRAALLVFLGGWLVLPVGHFPPGSADVVFPYWITGLAVPSDMLLTKAWVAPAAAWLGVLLFDRPSLARLRPAWLDAPMVLWCCWPLLQSAWVANTSPPGWIASLYLAGCWGLPWLLGRLYFATTDGALLLVKGLVLCTLACLPASLVEGVFGPLLYGAVYELHPFGNDGIVRYVGFRPLGFFENGNQFGLWVSLGALAAVWLARAAPPGRARHLYRWGAAVAVLMALAAQSVGGVLLLAIGAVFLQVCSVLRPRLMMAAALAVLLVSGAIYTSGVVPILKIGKETAVGRRVVDAFKEVGRGSFTWRISQDQKLLPQAMAHPLDGSGRWDWWRNQGVRPWGLALLLLGQFGLTGLCLALASMLAPALRAAWAAPRASGWRPEALPLLLAAVIGLAVLDALMNSFIFFPALLAAGALAVPASAMRRPRGEITRKPLRATVHRGSA